MQQGPQKIFGGAAVWTRSFYRIDSKIFRRRFVFSHIQDKISIIGLTQRFVDDGTIVWIFVILRATTTTADFRVLSQI